MIPSIFKKPIVIVPVSIGVFVAVGFILPLVQIQLRLSRNGTIAKQLADSLEAKYPGAKFRGAASYQREMIRILVADGIDEAKRPEIEQWLRDQKTEQSLELEIWLTFPSDQDNGTVI